MAQSGKQPATSLAGAVTSVGTHLGDDVAIIAELGRGVNTAVYHVQRRGVDYALKILQHPAMDGERIAAAFRREAALLARVNHPGVPKVYDVGCVDGRPYLVLEFLQGRSLTDVLAAAPLDEGPLILIAADVAAALVAAHRAGVVHRDIKPANIIINGGGRARLIDFGLAALERTAPVGPAAIGTFDYSPPEQTGMLNRPVDARSDLYSLGVVLFKCATGVLPFLADDVGELIAMHATVPAPDPRSRRPDLSGELADVMTRLLAKDPDDRFQTAGELLSALDRLPAAATTARTAHPPDDSEPLVGRDDQLAALATRWTHARSGHGGIVLISGAPGAGKTSLAETFAEAARADGALVLSGKADVDSALPLAVLRDAVEAHLRAVTVAPAAERDAAIERLRSAAGAGLSLLRPLSPTLNVLLDAPLLASGDRHDQFAGAVASFLASLPDETGGVLLLDDVQWLDEVSRAVLRRLVEEIGDGRLLVVATARDDSASEAGVRAFESAVGAALDLRIPLERLDADATAHLISGYLAGSAVGPEVIAELSARGRGNPFTILEFLRSLIDVGALRPCWGAWRLDTHLLEQLDLPTDVLDLVLARVDGLREHTRGVLAAAAAIGNVVETGLLAEVTGADAASAMAEAVGRGLVHPRGSTYAFVHDRIREALLAAFAPADLRALHQRIAEALDRRGSTDPASVYATARHYAAGESDRTPHRVFSRGWAAGQLALDENAPDAALSFLETAHAAARRAGITPDSRFRETLGIAYWSTGSLEPARHHLEAGLATETDPVRRAALLLQLSHVLRTGWALTRAMACARQGLAELGVGVPASRVLFTLATVRAGVGWLASGNREPATDPARGETAERLLLQVLLCRAVAAAASIDFKPLQTTAFTVRAARYAHRLGSSPGYLSYLSVSGLVAGAMGLRRRRDRIYQRAKDMAVELGDPNAYANAVWNEAYARVLGNEILLREWADLCETHRRYLEVDFYTNILIMRCYDLLQRGYVTEALAWHDRGRSRISEAATEAFPGFAILADMAGALLGRAGDASAALAARAAEPLDAGHGIQYVVGAVQTALEQDELNERFEQAVEAFGRFGLSMSAIFVEYRALFAHIAFARLTQLRRAAAGDADSDELARRHAAAKTAVHDLKRAATTSGPGAGPPALALLRGYAEVATASLEQLRGRPDQALAVLARAETALVRLDAPLVEYEAARVRARALAGLGESVRSARHARMALGLAAEHGWTRRARWVHREFGAAVTPGPLGTAAAGRNTYAGSGHSSASSMDPYRRRLEALQQVSIVAAKVLDPHQLARVALDETLRILGGERAILFLADSGDGTYRPSLARDADGADIPQVSGYSSTLVERVAADRQPLVVTGSEEGAALGSQSSVVYGLRSIMLAPLEFDERLVGVVYLDSRVAKGVFSEADVDILTAVSSHIAVSLETARAAQLEVAVQVAREQRDTAELLRTAMNELSSTFQPPEVLEKLLGIMARTLPADRLCVLHIDDETGVLTVLGRGPIDRAGADPGVVSACPRGGHGERVAAPAKVAGVLGDVSSWLAVPLPPHRHGSGMLVAGSADPDRFTQAHQDLLSALAGQAAAAFDNARLFAEVRRLATTDGLTGACNRRHFTVLATAQLDVARRNHRPLVVMMLDIDHFKRVNDSYGHAVGDEVIRAVAQVLRRQVRSPDVFGRYGGEEFAVVQSEVHGDPLEIAERLRAAVAAVAVPGPDQPIRVTVSIGVAELKPDDDLDTLLVRADRALYEAKGAGRNRVAAG